MNPAETRQATLTEFLLARIAEDEESARAALTQDRWLALDGGVTDHEVWPVATTEVPNDREVRVHIARFDPARVLAECEAKRRIVRQARMAIRLSDETPDDGSPRAERIHGAATAWEYALDALALPYADHPDYREEWRA